MNKKTLERAIWEADRFIKIAKQIKSYSIKDEKGKEYIYINAPSKESGACKRASMDLTRALAEMRKP